MKGMMDRLAFIGAIALFIAVASFLLLFVFTVDPRYLTFSGYFVFYLALFVALWSLGYAVARFAMRNRRRRPAGLARRSALLALIIAGGVLLSQTRLLSIYSVLILIALGAGIEYYLYKR